MGRRTSANLILRASGASVICFTLAIVASQWLAFGIGERGTTLATNTAPTVVVLTTLRTDLRNLEMVTYQNLVDGRALSASVRFGAWRSGTRNELEAYLELPAYEGEKELWVGLRAAQADLDRMLDGLTANQPAAPLVSGTHLPELARAFDRLDGEVARCIVFNVGHSTELALSIVETWRRALYVTVALTVVVALLVSYATRQARRRIARFENELNERADEMENFAARVAHDLKSPLTALALSIDTAHRRAAEYPHVVRALERSRAGITRITRLVEGLHAFARAGARPEPGTEARLDEATAGVLEDVRDEASRAGIQLRTEGQVARHVACHPGVLESVLMNLVRNAVKYMDERPRREIVVRQSERAGRIRIEVEDTGPGIDPTLHESIFEPHVRGPHAGQPGIGLGLATVRKVADAHGGACGVRSTVGQGSTFWVELPAGSNIETDPREDSPGPGPSAT